MKLSKKNCYIPGGGFIANEQYIEPPKKDDPFVESWNLIEDVEDGGHKITLYDQIRQHLPSEEITPTIQLLGEY